MIKSITDRFKFVKLYKFNCKVLSVEYSKLFIRYVLFNGFSKIQEYLSKLAITNSTRLVGERDYSLNNWFIKQYSAAVSAVSYLQYPINKYPNISQLSSNSKNLLNSYQYQCNLKGYCGVHWRF